MEENNAEPIIEYRGVDISNSGNLVISNLDLSIRKGEFIYIIGKVGSGKTSIIRSMIGEIPIGKGSARVGDFDLTRLKSRQIPYLRRKIGVIFQDFQLLMDRSVYDNLKFVLKATGLSDRRLTDDRITEVLTDVGMEKKAHKMPHQLSGGEQQRIAIARALLNSPDIILADEPTGNLDNDTAEEIMELLLRIHQDKGPAIIMVTHNQNLLHKYPAKTLVCEQSSCNEVFNATDTLIDLSDFL